MNKHEWIAGILAEKHKKPLPVLSYPAIQKMGTTVRELIMSSTLQARGMKIVADSFPTLASVSLMDLSVEAECFGANIIVSDGEVPTVSGALVTTPEEAAALKVPPLSAGRAGLYVDAIKRAKELISGRPVLAGVIGPFSLAGRLVDVTEAMILCYQDPEMLKTVLDNATDFLVNYIRAYREAGADGVVIAEPLAGMLSPDLCAEFSEPYIRRIVQSCGADDFLLVYHNCGNGAVRMLDSILNTGCDMYHFGDAVDMREVLKRMPQGVVAMGNVSPANEFLGGTPKSVYEATQALLRDCAAYPNFVLSSGCDIPPLSPWENIEAFFRAAEEFKA